MKYLILAVMLVLGAGTSAVFHASDEEEKITTCLQTVDATYKNNLKVFLADEYEVQTVDVTIGNLTQYEGNDGLPFEVENGSQRIIGRYLILPDPCAIFTTTNIVIEETMDGL